MLLIQIEAKCLSIESDGTADVVDLITDAPEAHN
jgi:hypothetical protein